VTATCNHPGQVRNVTQNIPSAEEAFKIVECPMKHFTASAIEKLK